MNTCQWLYLPLFVVFYGNGILHFFISELSTAEKAGIGVGGVFGGVFVLTFIIAGFVSCFR